MSKIKIYTFILFLKDTKYLKSIKLFNEKKNQEHVLVLLLLTEYKQDVGLQSLTPDYILFKESIWVKN